MLRPLALLIAAALVPAAPTLAADGPPPAAEAPALPAIGVVAVVDAVLRDRVVATGTIGPAEIVFVQPQIEGQAIEEILADVGDRVEAGQVLARLSDSALTLRRSQLVASRAAAEAAVAQGRAQVAEAEAAAAEAERTLGRTEALRAQGTASQAALDDARSQAEIARARVAAARQGLTSAEAQVGLIDAQIADVDLSISRTEVRAPVAGIVTARSARIGAIASAAGGTPLFTLIRDGALEMNADVSEQDLLRLAPGQPATVRVTGLGRPITGRVRLVEPSVDPATRLGRIRIALDEPEAVRDGMFGEAEIVVAERAGPAAPVTAVASDGSVLLVEDGLVHRVTVTTGIRDGALVEIRSGLAAGAMLVARAGAFVHEGDRINPVPVQSASASN
ncbi:MAG: efflux RND transporter periplasmic adaptor subunit [Rhodobacteraceae bacterium]|nr:efflux RND transporter periplasmic adaptor subunit [Paracoccaceae bacterium]